eukprot:INCI18359.3.p1 GENE.INCI18359.3~~INCI18359.3.p1  ORF type:complete len:551 (-),score=80.53 INCI18359.3:265-1917(-)
MKLPLFATTALAASAAAARSASAAPASPPSFVVLFADDMGWSQPSAVSDRGPHAGDNGTISTPNLDKLAAEGIAFTNWYSAHHVCSPSRFSMMTGRLPVRGGIGFRGQNTNGVFTSEAVGGIPSNETTIAAALRDHGYDTYMVGKWHLGQTEDHLPTRRGFNEYYGIPFSCDMGISAWNYFNETHPPYQASPLPLMVNEEVIEQPANLATLTERYANKTIDYLNHASQTPDTPFYMYVSFNHIHNPNFASLDFCGSSGRGPVGDAAQEMDHAVGRIMEAAKDLGLDDNIVWFFTSDNGAPLFNDDIGNGPLRDGKTTTWEGGVREPAAIRWTGTIKPGQISDALVGTYDIFPTILSLANVSLEDAFASKAAVREASGHRFGAEPPVLDGVDLSPILLDEQHGEVGSWETSKGHDCILLYTSPQDAGPSAPAHGLGAVRCGNYKAHFFTTSTGRIPAPVPNGLHQPPVLFNLGVDGGESHPINPNSTEYEQAMQPIQAAVAAHIASLDNVPCQMLDPSSCAETIAPLCVGGNDPSRAVCKDPDSKAKYVSV